MSPLSFSVVFAFLFASAAADHHTACNAENVGTKSGFDNCLVVLKNEMNTMFPFIDFPTQLGSIVTATWNTTATEFSLCSCNVTISPNTLTSQPFVGGLQAVPSSQLRTKPILDFNFFNDSRLPAPGNYTLAMIDPYAGSISATTPFLHYLVINFNGVDLSSGETSASYIGAQPRQAQCPAPHIYFLLLFKQEREIRSADLSQYNGPSQQTPNFQYKFGSFVSDYKLTLVGATWQNARFDLYVAKQYDIRRSLDLTGFKCSELDNCMYTVPSNCPTPTSTMKPSAMAATTTPTNANTTPTSKSQGLLPFTAAIVLALLTAFFCN